MRTIERTSQFKRDYKREAKGIYRASLDTDLIAILTALTITRCPKSIVIMRLPATGKTTGTAISSPTCY
jgi:hypothetical protein